MSRLQNQCDRGGRSRAFQAGNSAEPKSKLRQTNLMKVITLFLLSGLFALTACTTQKRAAYTNYLQNATDTSGNRLTVQEPVIQKADLLSIKVYSQSADPRTDIPYNLPEQTVVGGGSSTAGFLVDQNGDIEYPRIGRLHAEGLTKAQLADAIRKRFENELTNPTVIVRFLNYRVTVLGEVKTPGSFAVPTERITILEALGLSGDITDYGNKSKVRVAREKNGEVETGFIDLTSKDLFQSPYYRLQQNDVVFVEQIKRKSEQVEQQATAQRISLITGIVSTLAIIFSVIRR